MNTSSAHRVTDHHQDSEKVGLKTIGYESLLNYIFEHKDMYQMVVMLRANGWQKHGDEKFIIDLSHNQNYAVIDILESIN